MSQGRPAQAGGMPSPAPLIPAREPSVPDLLLVQTGAALRGSQSLQTVNLQYHILQDGDFLGKGRDRAVPRAEILKKTYLLSSEWKNTKKTPDITKIMEIILHLLHQLQYWAASAISYKDCAYILQLEF